MASSADRLTEFEKAQKRYEDLINGQGSFKSLVEQKLGEKTNYNKDLITQQQNLQERNLALPSELRNQFSTGPIMNPLAQEALIQSRQSNVGSQLGSTNALLSARGQDQSKILGTANDFFSSNLQGAGTAAQTRYQLYQDALAEEASRRGSGGSGSSLLENLLNGLNGADGDEPIVSIETEEDNRSTGTKGLDYLARKGSGYGNILSSLPGVGNLYQSALKTFVNSKLGQNTFKGFLNLASSPLGKKYISQTNRPELQALKKIQKKKKK